MIFLTINFLMTFLLPSLIFGFKIKPEEMKEVKTLGDFCDYIENKMA